MRRVPSTDLVVIVGAGPGLGRAIGAAFAASGARVVLANQGKTPYDEVVTLRVWSGIGEVIPPAVERVKRALGGKPKRS
jgi:NAD(P)-dependent dehydrogenase (short-subunit alcohol dehydrogenase family)